MVDLPHIAPSVPSYYDEIRSALPRIVFTDLVGRDGWMAVLKSFGDASRTERGSPYVCLAAFIFDEAGAKQFAEQWEPKIKDLPGPFRTAACASGRDRKKTFKGWSKQRRHALLDDLADLSATIPLAAFVASVDPHDIEQHLQANPSQHDLVKGPYSLCLMAILERAREWVSRSRDGDKIAYFFECGDPGQAESQTFLMNIQNDSELQSLYRMHTYGFTEKSGTALFDAADFLAWEWQRNVLKQPDQWTERMRRFMARTKTPGYIVHLDRESIGLYFAVNRFRAVAGA